MTKHELTIEQIKGKKALLEKAIDEDMIDFEEETGCKVTNIRISRIDVSTMGNRESLPKVEIDLAL